MMEEMDTVMVALIEDIPMKVARMIGSNLIISTDGYPLDEDDIRLQIEKEAQRRQDSTFLQTYCTENMAIFNIVDDWAQIITFKRKDDSYLVFLIQYYDWKEGYGIIRNQYFILNGDVLTPTSNPLAKFPYIADNDDTLGVRYDFRVKNGEYDPSRLKINTAQQALSSGLVDNTINAELLWTGRDFVELASDYSMPQRDEIIRMWRNAMPEEAALPCQYARTDIDSDGNDEYVFCTSDGSNSRFAIFTYINDKLSLIAGNYDSPKDVKMYHGGFVSINDKNSGNNRHIRLMGSEICGIYNHNEELDEYTFSADRTITPDPISAADYKKAIGRLRREIQFNSLDWRYWNVEVAK